MPAKGARRRPSPLPPLLLFGALLAALGAASGQTPPPPPPPPPRRPPPKGELAARAASCERRVIDACATTLFVFGRRDVYLPQSFEEMAPHCQEEFEAESCIKSFARRCLQPFERQVAGLLMLGAGQVLRKRCSREGTREYLSHYKCIKRALPQLHDAMDQLIYTLMSVSGALGGGGARVNSTNATNAANSANATTTNADDSKIPVSCCSFARFQLTAQQIVAAQCGAFDAAAERYIGTKMIRGYVGDVLDLSCRGYELATSHKCAQLALPAGGFEWRANGTTGALAKLETFRPPPGPKPSSVVLPFLDIFTNL